VFTLVRGFRDDAARGSHVLERRFALQDAMGCWPDVVRRGRPASINQHHLPPNGWSRRGESRLRIALRLPD